MKFIIEKFNTHTGVWQDVENMQWQTLIVAREAILMLEQAAPGEYFRIVVETKEGRNVL